MSCYYCVVRINRPAIVAVAAVIIAAIIITLLMFFNKTTPETPAVATHPAHKNNYAQKVAEPLEQELVKAGG